MLNCDKNYSKDVIFKVTPTKTSSNCMNVGAGVLKKERVFKENKILSFNYAQ